MYISTVIVYLTLHSRGTPKKRTAPLQCQIRPQELDLYFRRKMSDAPRSCRGSIDWVTAQQRPGQVVFQPLE